MRGIQNRSARSKGVELRIMASERAQRRREAQPKRQMTRRQDDSLLSSPKAAAASPDVRSRRARS